MNMQATKMELIEMLIQTKKANVLKKIKAILEEEQESLSPADYKIIDSRRESHFNGSTHSFSWDEAKKKIQNR